ncbi:hypothetical protein SAMN05216281_11017 [Cryobacterium luteum]|nr:hypothetical protein SAMN05216281_11017 [Cryobacterium luteum]
MPLPPPKVEPGYTCRMGTTLGLTPALWRDSSD